MGAPAIVRPTDTHDLKFAAICGKTMAHRKDSAMPMYETSDFKKGLYIEVDGVPFQIVDFQHVKPGKGNAFTRTRMKNLLNNNLLEKTFKSGERVGEPDLE